MTRAFYPVSRKHHAASMAIDFGMKFKMRNGFWTPEGLLAISGAGDYRIEVSEDSSPLLNPQVGDMVVHRHARGERVARLKATRSKGWWLLDNHDIILTRQIKAVVGRKSLPFHWPEFEP